MSYQVEVRLVDIHDDGAMFEFNLTTPDGHVLGQTVNLKLMESAFLSMGLESEEEAIQRGELKGLFSLLERNDK